MNEEGGKGQERRVERNYEVAANKNECGLDIPT
jgi:hypothetical protein